MLNGYHELFLHFTDYVYVHVPLLILKLFYSCDCTWSDQSSYIHQG